MVSISRRALLTGGAAVAVTGAVGAGGWSMAPGSAKYRLKEKFGLNPDPYIPDVARGRIEVASVRSAAMGEVRLFTAVPDGFGDGAGLPVLVVLHGASATVDDFADFGFGEFATAIAGEGFPMVLAGTDDGPNGWLPDGVHDPFRMFTDELPTWLSERGFDAERRALWGWSRGGYGALAFAETHPEWTRALALFSPALHEGDDLSRGLERLGEMPVGIWCGDDDAFADGASDIAAHLPRPAEVESFGNGGHTRQYWNDHTLEMLRWIGSHLSVS